ncbi:MAG: glycoside hydrolase family 5 protein [Lachnospiraceae bacterium]|nr:glycoside hydrolase family 5 protein [Lachnospiraceae bacterium]
MKQRYMKRVFAFVLTLALVLTGSGISAALNNASASAASKKKKVTLKLSKTKLSLTVGKKKTLKITKKNVKKIKSKKWSSTKKSVATVSKSGKVTAKKAGSATIKVKIKYIPKGSKKAKTKTLKCKVTVTKKKTATPTPKPTSKPTPTPFFTWEKTPSNITAGKAVQTAIPNGNDPSITIKDNGSVRKNLTAQELADKHMGLAINLGNTMEATIAIDKKMAAAANGYANIEATAFETSWGAAETTQAYMDRLHSYGINTVRIPVAWSNMDSEDETYTINDKYLARVEEIVNYALNNGMYVIINDHWDNGWWGQFGARKIVEVPATDADGNEIKDEDGNVVMRQNRVADEKTRANAMERFKSYWTQIAKRFENYSDHLIFESANEELGERLNDKIYLNGYSVPTDKNNADDIGVSGNLTKQQCYDKVNEINQAFVDVVRGSGSENNKYRHLLIAGFDTNFEATADSNFKMPTDITENGKSKLFVSVHSYNPGTFCLDEAKEGAKYTDANKTAMENEYKFLKRFVDEGYAIIVGEDGVVKPTVVSNSARTVVQRLRDAVETASQYHATVCFWETGQYFDRQNCTLKFKDVALLFNELTGSKGDTSMTGLTGVENRVFSVVDTTDKTPVWSWKGTWYKNGGEGLVGDDIYTGGTTTGTKPEDFAKTDSMGSTIDGDQTTIQFDATGYQAFLKIDMSKYVKPAIKITFSDIIPEPAATIGGLQLGVNDKPSYKYAETVPYSKYNGKALVLDGLYLPTEKDPWLSITFDGMPIVTGIDVYETGK